MMLRLQKRKGKKATAELPKTVRVDHVIRDVMEQYPDYDEKTQAKFYEEVHQRLAPLARDLERENILLRMMLKKQSN